MNAVLAFLALRQGKYCIQFSAYDTFNIENYNENKSLPDRNIIEFTSQRLRQE